MKITKVKKSEFTIDHLSAGGRCCTAAELYDPREPEVYAVDGVLHGPLPSHYRALNLKHPNPALALCSVYVDLSQGQLDQLTIDDPRINWSTLSPRAELVD